MPCHRPTPPDVVLLDIALPQRDGPDGLKAPKAEFPCLPVLMLSPHPDRQYAVRNDVEPALYAVWQELMQV